MPNNNWTLSTNCADPYLPPITLHNIIPTGCLLAVTDALAKYGNPSKYNDTEVGGPDGRSKPTRTSSYDYLLGQLAMKCGSYHNKL